MPLARPRYHYVIVDYLCERISGAHVAASDVTDLEFAREDDLDRFHLTETALRILHKAFAMHRAPHQFEVSWPYPAIAAGNDPLVLSRLPNSSTAICKSPAVKSGQRFCTNTNSANAHSHNRKSESRCSPPVRISRSTSVEPPRLNSARTFPNASRRKFRDLVKSASRKVDRFPRRIVDRQTQVQSRAAQPWRLRHRR